MSLLRKFLTYTNLQSEMDDYEVIHANIQKDIIFKGTNLWILVFAIFIASIGLNMNSTAVIIGAMLISPLMGPINGMVTVLRPITLHCLEKHSKISHLQ